MTGMHVQVSTAWLADRIRETSRRIRDRSGPAYFAAITDELDQLATELEALASFPPPTPTVPSPPSVVDPSTLLRAELSAALRDARGALERQPHEPTVLDLLEVLLSLLTTGGIPARSVPSESSWTEADGTTCVPDLCPLGTVAHTHRDGRIAWT